MALLVVLRCWKNLGYSNYQVGVNERYDYETSNRTSTLSVTRRSQPKSQRRRLACDVVASNMFNRLDMNHLHLNAVIQKTKKSNEEEEEKKEEKERNAPQFTVKSTASDRKKHQYARHHEYEPRRQVHHYPENMAQQQAQHEPFQPSFVGINDHSPNDPYPCLTVGIGQTHPMASATQSSPQLKSLHKKVSNLSVYVLENNG